MAKDSGLVPKTYTKFSVRTQDDSPVYGYTIDLEYNSIVTVLYIYG